MKTAIIGLGALALTAPATAGTGTQARAVSPAAAAPAAGALGAGPHLMTLANGVVLVTTAAAASPSAPGQGTAAPDAGATFARAFAGWDAVAEPAARPHVSWSRASDLLGRPIAFSRAARVRPIDGSASLATLAPGGLPSSMPVSARAITSGFGMREHPLLGTRRAHLGIDLAAPSGSPIVATSDGVVGSAEWRGGYGLFVALEHGSGVETRYGHMSRLAVAAGESVRKGQVIGYVGSTGLSTGPHLHYEVRVNGQAVDPVHLLGRR